MEDDEMEEAQAPEGDDLEIDLDYEFDAPRYFYFSRPEFPCEAQDAELWFQTARSYPHSPLIAKIDTGNATHMENMSTVPNLEEVRCSMPSGTHLDVHTVPDFSVPSNYTGSTLHSPMPHDAVLGDRKFHVKGPFSKGSTLMKPTASHLAKQNQSRVVKNEYRSYRLRKSLIMKSERSIEDPNDNTSHAAKRRRLEGGHICKVLGVKQEIDLTHKVPKKSNDHADGNSRPPRLKLTIPREPELETTKRATTFRARRPRFKNTEDLQDGTTCTFNARPLNRKILEAPSLPFPGKSTPRLPNFQEFHLKTHERAIKHSLAAASSSIVENHVPDSSTQGGVTGFEKSLNQPFDSSQLQSDDKKLAECGNMLPQFIARPLNKKIISSKGDLGVFRTTKREVTKPKEFNFSTNRKCQQSPLTELFNKLSLASEAWQPTASESKLQQPVHVAPKDSKENMINPVI